MKKSKKVLSKVVLLMFVLTICMGTYPIKNVEAATTVKIDPNVQFQTLEGWGINLAWLGNTIGKWPEDKRNEIADLIFGDNGLDVNIVRFNIGGGDNPSHDHMNTGSFVNAEMEGYQPSQGNWNWDGDEGERVMLQLAKERGVNIFEAFSNSAPYWMTKSGCSAGNLLSLPNFNEDYTQSFADYLTEVVKHARDYWGIDFRTIEPFNEPDGFWHMWGHQEGMIVFPLTQNKIIKALHDKIVEKGLNVQITVNDVWNKDKLKSHYNKYDSTAKSYISQFNVHSYSGSDCVGDRILAESENKRLWMSEFGCGDGTDLNNVDNATHLAQVIIKDLREMRPQAWVYWQPVENKEERNDSWGFIHANYRGDSYQYWFTKQYYAFGQFSKFIKAGYKLININNSNAIAAYDKSSKNLVVVMLNNSDSDINYTYDLSMFSPISSVAQVYRTSSNENLVKINDVNISNNILMSDAKANSITTYVISNIDFIPRGQLIEIDNNTIGTDINQFNYVGNWFYENDAHISSESNSYCEVKFEGTGIEIYGNEGPDYGMVGISVDGGAETYVDLYSSENKDNTYIYSSKRLKPNVHTLKIRLTDKKNPLSTGFKVSITHSNIINYIDKKINIVKNDDRQITDLKIGLDFYINGSKHYDYEKLGTFNCTKQTVLEAYGGSFDGTKWVGDFLAFNRNDGDAEILQIINMDPREITNVRVHVDFKIDGSWYYDYEDIGDFNGIINLKLNAYGGKYNGIRWVGDFLKKN